jgi:heterotetrameric sarcosine oxidase gamma subunit
VKSNIAAWRECRDIGCVLLTAAVPADQIASKASGAARVELPLVAGAIKTAAGRTALWLTPRSWLIRCSVEEEGDLVGALNAAFPDKLAHAAGFTDALCWLELSNAGALDLLTEGGFVSFERNGLAVGHAKRTLIAQIAAIVVRAEESVWLVAVERSRAGYFVNWLSAAAQSRPVQSRPVQSRQ